MKKKTTRAYNFDIKTSNSEEHGNHITGRPIVYDSRTDLGWFDEIIESGALNGTNLKDVRFLVNHDTSMIPLARSRNNNEHSTMQMTVDDIGMEIRVDLDTENNSEAKSLYSAIDRGDISGMSFMFTVDGEKWDDLDSDHPTRRITKISEVFEVSAVTFPAYEDTTISTRDAEACLAEAREKHEAILAEKREKELELEKAKFRNRLI